MQTPILQQNFAQTLLTHFRAMKTRDGDELVRAMLSAERVVTNGDRQMTLKDKTEWIAAIDAIEAELLGPSAENNSEA